MSTSDGDGPPPEPDRRPAAGGDRRAYLFLADRLAAVQREHEELVHQVTGMAAASSGILPRLDNLEQAVERVGAALDVAGLGERDGTDPDDATPATRWSQLDRDELDTAWNALGAWVAEVLNGEYRLNRVQLPDCWPVHPRAVRELAWLRTLHVATRRSGPSVPPEVVGEWHTRWLPAAIHNIATVVDPRECAPGRHRVTDAERRQFHRRLEEAEQAGLVGPPLTSERGVDRPRYFPSRMPPRRGRQEDLDPSPGGRVEVPAVLDELTPPPPSIPEHWREYFLDARLAEIGSAAAGGDESS